MFKPLDDDDPVVAEIEREEMVRRLARTLMDKHGLYDWRFDYMNDIGTVGLCSSRRKTIFYSKRFLHVGMDEITDTLLHEIAHALTPDEYEITSTGKRRWIHHGPKWKAKAREIGARPERCAPHHVQAKDDRKKMFFFECPECKQRWYRHKIKSNMIGRLSRCCRKPLKAYKIQVRS